MFKRSSIKKAASCRFLNYPGKICQINTAMVINTWINTLAADKNKTLLIPAPPIQAIMEVKKHVKVISNTIIGAL